MGYTPHVLVIGGGVVGTAIARDCAIRGLAVTVVEQGTLCSGATGRMGGVLYNGTQFIDSNPKAALLCRRENRILRQTAAHCIEATGGIVLPGDGEDSSKFAEHCEENKLRVREMESDHLDRAGVSSAFGQGVRTPDATIDPFSLTFSNMEGARTYGAEIETQAEVVDLLTENGQIVGVEIEHRPSSERVRAPTSADPSILSTSEEEDETAVSESADEAETESVEEEESDGDAAETEEDSNGADGDKKKEMPGEIQRSFPGASEDDGPEMGEREEIRADFVVNAAGPWADRIAGLAGIELPLTRERGVMVVVDGEQTGTVLTRRSDRALPTTITPYRGNTVLGPIRPDAVDGDPIETLLAEAREVLPAVEDAAVIRSYSGVWTQHANSDGIAAGPGTTLVDHSRYDDQWGMLSVVGATLTTHRVIAKNVVDRVCSEFGIDRECKTDELELPGSEQEGGDSSSGFETTTAERSGRGEDGDPILCETRSVGREAVQSVLADAEHPTDLTNVRMQTGATMGACQGGRCGHRIAAELYPEHDPETVEQSLSQLLDTRWEGRRDVLRGEQLASALSDYELHTRVLGRDRPQEAVSIDSFDDGGDGTTTRERSAVSPGPDATKTGSTLLEPTALTGEGEPTCCEAVRR